MRLFEFQNIFQDDVAYLFRNRDATRSQIVNNWTAPAENAGQQDDDVGQRSSWTQKKKKLFLGFISLSFALSLGNPSVARWRSPASFVRRRNKRNAIGRWFINSVDPRTQVRNNELLEQITDE